MEWKFIKEFEPWHPIISTRKDGCEYHWIGWNLIKRATIGSSK